MAWVGNTRVFYSFYNTMVEIVDVVWTSELRSSLTLFATTIIVALLFSYALLRNRLGRKYASVLFFLQHKDRNSRRSLDFGTPFLLDAVRHDYNRGFFVITPHCFATRRSLDFGASLLSTLYATTIIVANKVRRNEVPKYKIYPLRKPPKTIHLSPAGMEKPSDCEAMR